MSATAAEFGQSVVDAAPGVAAAGNEARAAADMLDPIKQLRGRVWKGLKGVGGGWLTALILFQILHGMWQEHQQKKQMEEMASQGQGPMPPGMQLPQLAAGMDPQQMQMLMMQQGRGL